MRTVDEFYIDTERPPPRAPRAMGLWWGVIVYAMATFAIVGLVQLRDSVAELRMELAEVQRTCEAPPPDTIKLEVPVEVLALLNKFL